MDLLKCQGKGSQHLQWTQGAFDDVRTSLWTNTVLYAPLPSRHFRLYTDVSNSNLGAVLTQDTPTGEQPIFFLSRKSSKAEQNYAVIEREALAIRWATDYFKYYLWERRFTVITDHAPLQWLNRRKDANPRLMRWYFALQPYTFQVLYQKGIHHSNADFFFKTGRLEHSGPAHWSGLRCL